MRLEQRLCAFLLHWQGVGRRRAGLAGLRRTVAQLQDLSLPFSELESSILPARLADYSGDRLDGLMHAGEVLWQGRQPLGQHDGQVALYLGRDFPRLGRISVFAPGARAGQIRDTLLASGGLEFERLNQRLGGFADDLLRTLWTLVWNGEVTSDSLDALRARASTQAARYRPRPRPRYTTRRRVLPGAAGRWKLLSGPQAGFAPEPERRRARFVQWLDRYGVLCPQTLDGEATGMDDKAPELEALTAEGAAARRDLMGTGRQQFWAPGAEQAWEAVARQSNAGALAACDPANPWGSVVPWPRMAAGYRPQRTAGARVLFADGLLLGYLTRTGRALYTPRSHGNFPRLLGLLIETSAGAPVFLERVDGELPYRTLRHGDLVAAGFSPSRRGYLLRAAR